MIFRLAFISFLLISCVPLPHRRTVISSQEGVILSNGKPLSGKKVLQSFTYKDITCKNAEVTVTTDSKGAFSFKEKRDTFLFVSMGDQHFYTYICLEDEGKVIWLTFQDVTHENGKPSKYQCEVKHVRPPALPCKPL